MNEENPAPSIIYSAFDEIHDDIVRTEARACFSMDNRAELAVLDKEIHEASKTVVEIGAQYLRASSRLDALKSKRNKLRMEFKLTEE